MYIYGWGFAWIVCLRLEEPGGHGSLGHGLQHKALDLGYRGSSSSWDSTRDFEWDFRLSHLQMWVKWAYRYVRSSVRWLRGHFLRSKAGSSAFKWWMLCSSFSGLLRSFFPPRVDIRSYEKSKYFQFLKMLTTKLIPLPAHGSLSSVAFPARMRNASWP